MDPHAFRITNGREANRHLARESRRGWDRREIARRAAQGWAHSYGKGKVAVFIPGHSPATISHPMVRRCVQNITEWLTK